MNTGPQQTPPPPRMSLFHKRFFLGEITKCDSGEMRESVSRVSEKTLTKLISQFLKEKV